MSMLHSVFLPNKVGIGDFESWSGKKTAVVVKFADMFELNASKYTQNQIAPIWEYGHVPLLTLEPWGSEQVEREIASGSHSEVVDAWADAIQSYVTGHSPEAKIFVRFAHEMNGDWYPWSEDPTGYKRMWKHFRRAVVTRDGVDRSNVKFVWAVNCDDTAGPDVEDYYPGHEYVDWVGIDGYNFGSKRDWSSWRSPGNTFNDMLNRVRSVSSGKPVAIPETGSTAERNGSDNRGAKADWIHSLYQWADNRDIRMLSWFNTDKTVKWEKGKETMDWSVYGFGRKYDAYHDEVTKPRVVAPSGYQRLTAGQFAGDFSGGGNSGGDQPADQPDDSQQNNDQQSDSGEKENMDKKSDFVLGIGNPNNNDLVKYELFVNGYIWPEDGTDEGSDKQVSDFHIVGETMGSWDKWNVRGWITAFNLEGGAQVTIDGENVSASEAVDYRPNRFSDSGNPNKIDKPDRPNKPDKPDKPNKSDPDQGSNQPVVSPGGRDLRDSHGIVNRPYQSQSDRTITVGDGKDFETLQAAMNQLPLRIEHEITIQLGKQRHNDEPADSINCPPLLISAAYASLKIVGDVDNPNDYVLDVKQANFNFYSGTAQNSAIEGVRIEGTVQNRVGYLELDNCVVVAGERFGSDQVPVDMYGGHYQLLGTRLVSDGAAINLVENGSVSMNSSCEIDVDGPLFTTGQGGGIVDLSGDVSISCNGRATEGWEPGMAVVRDPNGAANGIDPGPSGRIERPGRS